MFNVLIADIETNAIHKPSRLWMIGVIDFHTDEYTSYHGDDIPNGIIRLLEADVIIGHNFKSYDAKVLKQMTNGLCDLPKKKIIDTLEISRKFYDLPNHKLSEWGSLFGYPKLDHNDFSRYSAEMDTYCERDVRLNRKIFDFFLEDHPDVVSSMITECANVGKAL